MSDVLRGRGTKEARRALSYEPTKRIERIQLKQLKRSQHQITYLQLNMFPDLERTYGALFISKTVGRTYHKGCTILMKVFNDNFKQNTYHCGSTLWRCNFLSLPLRCLIFSALFMRSWRWCRIVKRLTGCVIYGMECSLPGSSSRVENR